MKTRLWQKPSAVPERKPSPVPVELVEERKTTSTPSQQRYTLVYLQPTFTSHGNQPTLVPNLQQASHYRPAAPVFQSPYFPMNYNAYLPYDRLAWANAQSANLTSYPTAVHPMVANVSDIDRDAIRFDGSLSSCSIRASHQVIGIFHRRQIQR